MTQIYNKASFMSQHCGNKSHSIRLENFLASLRLLCAFNLMVLNLHWWQMGMENKVFCLVYKNLIYLRRTMEVMDEFWCEWWKEWQVKKLISSVILFEMEHFWYNCNFWGGFNNEKSLLWYNHHDYSLVASGM